MHTGTSVYVITVQLQYSTRMLQLVRLNSSLQRTYDIESLANQRAWLWDVTGY